MPKKAKEVILTETEQRDLQKLSNSQKEEARLVQRAKAVCLAHEYLTTYGQYLTSVILS